jgi:hypothetical protein
MMMVKLDALHFVGLANLSALNMEATLYHGLTCDFASDPAFGLTQSKEVNVVL